VATDPAASLKSQADFLAPSGLAVDAGFDAHGSLENDVRIR
jgi:hypothetical protein